MKIKKAFSSNAFTRHDIEYTICALAYYDYSGIELLMDHPHLWPYNNTWSIDEVRRILQSYNMSISSLNAFTCSRYWLQKPENVSGPPGQNFGPCFCDYKENWRRMRIDYTKKVVDLADILGAKDVSVSSGYRPTIGNRPMAWQNMTDALKEVVDYAVKKDVRINMEAEPGCLVGSKDEVIEIVQQIDSDHFGVNADIGHFYVSDPKVNTAKVIDELFRELPGKINGVHFEDIGHDDDGDVEHYHLIPGQGAMPLKEIVQMFLKHKYDGWFTVELYTMFGQPEIAAEEAMKYLQKLEKEM